ncbi:AMP deaminase 1 [Aphelenchoides avenae]|nr:AMP deaminase 1 [Aphelenchus avenae]
MTTLMGIVESAPARTYSHHHLKLLGNHFEAHVLANYHREKKERKEGRKRDFYNCAKVDTHIHAAASMTLQHVDPLIKKLDMDDVIERKNGDKTEQITLRKLFGELGIEPSEWTVDWLDMHADKHMKHDFERFNNSYNPGGHKPLRDLLLRYKNLYEPLAEEYSLAKTLFSLSTTDLCEIARNSVLISGFEHDRKKDWLGENYKKEGVSGNDIEFSNVPHIRVSFRQEALESELNELYVMSFGRAKE